LWPAEFKPLFSPGLKGPRLEDTVMLATQFFRSTLLALIVECAIGSTFATAQERTDFPADARASYEKGRDLQKNGQLDDAIRAYEDAIKLGMEAFPRVHLQRASSNLDLKKYSAAIAQYTNFIKQFGLEDSCRY
jgi:outer membrane protein assembly factor BamD (BamD/ComL family)